MFASAWQPATGVLTHVSNSCVEVTRTHKGNIHALSEQRDPSFVARGITGCAWSANVTKFGALSRAIDAFVTLSEFLIGLTKRSTYAEMRAVVGRESGYRRRKQTV
jgi:hypothetical protein